jgi:lariat debranching enzyme
VTIAIEGCCHGELDGIYERLARHEQSTGRPIDLLLCCGDFQSVRNIADFHSMAVPPKYRTLGSFYRYYSGQQRAPILTVFIGGNHEASQPLQELYYGGWVAPNVYYLGAAGVVRYKGIGIGGISGIYKSHDYKKGRFETFPLDNSALRSIYHVREVDVYRLKCYAQTARTIRPASPVVNIMLSHDWPRGIEHHGNTEGLLKKKPFFRDEVQQNCLGSPPNEELLLAIKPPWWFSAHLHVKFKATMRHSKEKDVKQQHKLQLTPSQVIKSSSASAPLSTTTEERPNQTTEFIAMTGEDPCSGADLTDMMTQFLSLDKCLPRRHFLSIVHIEKPLGREDDNSSGLSYDPEWLAVLQKTHHLSSTSRGPVHVPVDIVSASREEVDAIRTSISLDIDPASFQPTVPAHQGPPAPLTRQLPPPLRPMGNPQTDNLLRKLGLDHNVTIPYAMDKIEDNKALEDENEIMIDYEGVETSLHSDLQVKDDDDANAIDLDNNGHEDDVNAINLDDNEEEDANEIDLDIQDSKSAQQDDAAYLVTPTIGNSKRPRVNS